MIASFVRGGSVRDVGTALADALGYQAAISTSTVAEVCQAIKAVDEAWARRRATVIGRFPGGTSRASLVWAVLDRASRGWCGLTMTADGIRLLQDLRRCLLEPPRQLRPRAIPSNRPADAPETVGATG